MQEGYVKYTQGNNHGHNTLGIQIQVRPQKVNKGIQMFAWTTAKHTLYDLSNLVCLRYCSQHIIFQGHVKASTAQWICPF